MNGLEKWAKTLLLTYDCYEIVADSIDRYIEERGRASLYSTLMMASANSSRAVCHELGRLMCKKVDLINLKVLVEQTLDRMTPRFARVLILRYFDDMTIEQIADVMGVTARTVSRNLGLAIEEMAEKLAEQGYTDKHLCGFCATNKWIMNLFMQPYTKELNAFMDIPAIKCRLARMGVLGVRSY